MSNISSTLIRPQILVDDSQSANAVSTDSSAKKMVMKCCYKGDQQVKFLNLQAEIDCLLEQLQTIKEQRMATVDETGSPDDATES